MELWKTRILFLFFYFLQTYYSILENHSYWQGAALWSPLSPSSLFDKSRQLVIAQRYLYLFVRMVAINVKHRPFPFPVLVIYVSSKSTHQLYPGDTTKLLTDLLVSLSAFFRYLYSTEQRPDICTIQCMTPTIFRPHKFSQLQEAPMEESPFQTNNLHSLEQHRRRNRFITFRSVIKK